MDQRSLPFEVEGRLESRSTVLMRALVDGAEVTSERYTLGSGQNRNRVAKKWAADKRLCNGKLVSISDIENVLDTRERALRERNDAGAEEDDEQLGFPCATWVDESCIVELAWNLSTGQPDLVTYDRNSGEVSRSDRVELSDRLLIPTDLCTGIVTPGPRLPGNVLLPTGCDPEGKDDHRIREALRAFVDRYVELPGDTAAIAVEYILLSWVHDGFDEVPYIGFRTADCGRGKSRALETVGACCYRPILCGGGSTAAATLRLLDTFRGTLVADEFDQRDSELGSELARIINQGFQQRRPLVRCEGEDSRPRVFNCFGPKLFALRKGFADDAIESRVVSIRMRQRTRSDIPISLPRAQFDAESLALRNRLLAWRFASLGRVRINPAYADPRLEDRLNQIGLPLLAVAGTAEGRARIVEALRQQQDDVAGDRGDTLAGMVFEAGLAILAAGGVLRPGDIAQEVNRREAAALGVGVDKLRESLGPQKVGLILKKDLELCRERDRGGTYYRLTRERGELLCARFGIPLERLPTLGTAHLPRTLPRTLPQENPLFDPENAVCDKCGNDGSFLEGVGDKNDHRPAEPAPDTDDLSDLLERDAIQATEAEAVGNDPADDWTPETWAANEVEAAARPAGEMDNRSATN